MSRFKLVRHLLASTGGGGASLLAPIYDTRFGTATDASGRITFDLHSGNKRVYLDSAKADDTGNGLTAATAKKTFDAAFALLAGGDQLMIAGGSAGGTYTDNKLANWTLINGYSVTYPTGAQSYDRADPTNSAKYGNLVGSQMPSITLATASSSFQLSSNNGGLANYYFLKGLEFTAANDGAGYNVGSTFRHDGLAVQNCRFDKVSWSLDDAGDVLGNCQTVHISKCSFSGTWTNSTNVGAYLGGITGLYWEDNVFVHCGWKIVAGSENTRGATGLNGDPNQFSHAFYYHATNLSGRAQRIVGVDSAHDSLNFRGSVDSNCCVSLDDAMAMTAGGFSGGYTEAPLGVDQHHTDLLFMGGSTICNGAGAIGTGIYTTNTKPGSYVKKALAFDNPNYAIGFNSHVLPHCDDSRQIDQYLLIDQFRAYQYAAGLESTGTTNNTKIHDSWTNSTVDTQTPVSLNTTLTSVTTQGGAATYPLAKTRDQVVSALLTAVGVTPSGVSYLKRKGQLVNLMCWRPELPWAQLLIDIAFPAYGMTPTYATATVPDLSAETPRAVYS